MLTTPTVPGSHHHGKKLLILAEGPAPCHAVRVDHAKTPVLVIASTHARPSPIGSQVDALERFDAENTAAVADDFLGVGTHIGMTWTRPVCPYAEAKSGLVLAGYRRRKQ